MKKCLLNCVVKKTVKDVRCVILFLLQLQISSGIVRHVETRGTMNHRRIICETRGKIGNPKRNNKREISAELRRFARFLARWSWVDIKAGERGGANCDRPVHIGRQCRPNMRGFERFREIRRVTLKIKITLEFKK